METYQFSILLLLLHTHGASVQALPFSDTVQATDYSEACREAWRLINAKCEQLSHDLAAKVATAEFRIARCESSDITTEPLPPQERKDITMQNVVVTNNISFRWDEQRRVLIVTTQTDQYTLDAGQSLELADLLYHHKDELFRASNGWPEPEIPPWASPEAEA